MTRLHVGVDGGGTRTRALVVDAAGRALARAEGGASRIDPADPSCAAATVLEVVDRALAAAGVAGVPAGGPTTGAPAKVQSLWCGLAGAGTAHARHAVEALLVARGVAGRVTVATDAEAAFADAFEDGAPGILLIAGTGSIGWARDATGVVARAGGLGPPGGDPGSAAWIGHEALQAGRVDPPPAGMSPATLAPQVTAAAGAGDPVAAAILAQAAADLAELVRTLVPHVQAGGDTQFVEVACAGALVTPGGPLHAALARELAGLPVRLLTRTVDPAAGAARRALQAG